MVDNQLQRRFENTIIRTVEVQPTMTIAMVNKAHLHLVSHLAELSCASAATIPDSTRNTAGACSRSIRKILKACSTTLADDVRFYFYSSGGAGSRIHSGIQTFECCENCSLFTYLALLNCKEISGSPNGVS